eukprot:CAMPEP_0201552304 /NCGR_PEP_ID=MMETSP0173_2-20130828/14787_1 /ASSEMBLY_ACC=CAM_ASM_000268 /TAXON_ID=218659 /ORGANISM="Vexillifera sp., Strain DIVA3 564/2" /LENGTH=86 /DNA_ID=CAMNT_0047962759 /DNA_START=123 /DNA_END=383 /DNA_ORIENTATION=+
MSLLSQQPYESDNGEYTLIATYESRGWEPIEADITRFTWQAKSKSGTTFTEIEFEQDQNEYEWTDYDENANEPVSIMAMKSKIEKQ